MKNTARRIAVVLSATAVTIGLMGAAAPAEAAKGKRPKPAKRYSLTVMGTTDLHGNIFNWDYFKDAEYTDAKGNAKGLARVATLVDRIRKERGRGNTLLIDAGDTIQGTPLTYYYAKVDPITAPGGPVHPMAQAMNAVVDAVAARLGNSRTVCRACYIHPLVLARWQDGRLADEVADVRRRFRRAPAGLDRAEHVTLRWLEAASEEPPVSRSSRAPGRSRAASRRAR